MQAPRFYLDRALAVHDRVELPPAVAHHAGTVLRLREGDAVVLFNGQGGEFQARLVADRSNRSVRLQAELNGFDAVEREASLRITLIQALATSDKIDWIIEKAVEIGVAGVIVTPAARSTARLAEDRRERRLEHWRELSIAASCQCGRNRLMPVHAAATLAQALEAAQGSAVRWILDPGARLGLDRSATMSASLALAVGPEGGFNADEMGLAARAGFSPVRLGPRVLRTETAGLAAASACLALNGEFSRERG